MKPGSARSLKKDEQAFLFPGESAAEPWEIWLKRGKEMECLGTCEQPSAHDLKTSVTLALPVTQVYSLALWLNETDERLFQDMIVLQLELRGLQPRVGQAAVFDWSVVMRDEKRTLLYVAVLPARMPEELELAGCKSFDFAVRYLPLGADTLNLWREQDQWVIAITRGIVLVHTQVLGEGRLDEPRLQDITCILTALAMEAITAKLTELVLWADATPAEIVALQKAVALPIRPRGRPSPFPPEKTWKLIPTGAQVDQKAQAARRGRNRILVAGALVYVLTAMVLLVRLAWTAHQVALLRVWQDANAPSIQALETTQAAWKDLAPVVDEKSYPLELLLHVAESLPGDQLHLTVFEYDGGRLRIKGEAKNAAVAFQFFEKLKDNPRLRGIIWNMGQPQLLPNDLAQLQIEGTYGSAN